MERRKQILAAMLMAATLAGECMAQAAQPILLTDGTPVRLRLNRTISSANAQVGETVDFEVIEDIQVNGMTIVPRGGTALATVTEAMPKRRMGRGGKLNVNIDHVRLANGDKVSMRAIRENKGGSHTGAMTGAIVATSIVFFPAAPLFLLMKGKDITVPKGTEITAYINGDTRLDAARFGAPAPVYAAAAPAPAPAPAPAYMRAAYNDVRPAGMTNEDVLDLRAAGFGDDVIAAKIRSAQPAFRLDTRDLVELKRAGVSQALIAAMIERTSRN